MVLKILFSHKINKAKIVRIHVYIDADVSPSPPLPARAYPSDSEVCNKLHCYSESTIHQFQLDFGGSLLFYKFIYIGLVEMRLITRSRPIHTLLRYAYPSVR
jgi:hypothetical protein